MHTYALDIVCQNGERAQARAERTGGACAWGRLPPGERPARALRGLRPGLSGRGGAQASPASRRR